MKIKKHIRFGIIVLVLISNNLTHNLAQIPQTLERLLFQTDRDIYIAGEDVLLNALLLTKEKNNNTKVLYVEIYDTENNVIAQKKLEINGGGASGRISLPESISTQAYLIRAYTNIMKNDRPEIFPAKVITVIDPDVPVNALETEEKDGEQTSDTTNTKILINQDCAHIAIDVANIKNKGDSKFLLYSSTFEKVGFMPFFAHQKFEISKQDIPKGLLYLALYDDEDNLLAIRPIYNWPDGNELDIQLLKSNFKPREKVELSIQNKDFYNSVSVSVIKKGAADFNTISSNILNNINLLNTFLLENHSLVQPLKDTIDFYLEKAGTELLNEGTFSKWVEEANVTDKKYSNEVIGPSLTGRVLDKNDAPLNDARLYLSVFNGKQQFHSTKSDSLGNFSFSLYPKTYGANRLVVRTQQNDSVAAKILLDYDYSSSYTYTQNSLNIDVDSADRNLLEELYVNAQINKRINLPKENFLNDTLFSMFGTPNFSIKLDDYINLPKLEEVFSEIVPYVTVKRKKGVSYLSVFNEKRGVYYNSPLVLLDFIPVYNIEELLEIRPSNLCKIDVINRTYRLGEFNYHGIVSITTKKNNFADYSFPGDVVFFDFESVSFLHDFYHADYSEAAGELSRIPDFRTVLYWNPNLETKNISFYTSDHCSDYQIVITGVDGYGHIVKSTRDITVKQ